MGFTYNNVSLFEKWVSLTIMCHCLKNGSHLEYVPLFEKWVTLGICVTV